MYRYINLIRLMKLIFKSKFYAAKDLKSKWKVVNSVMNNNLSTTKIPSIQTADNHIETDPSKIVNIFNEYFINVPYDILHINQETVNIDESVRYNLIHSNCNIMNFFFFPVCEEEIYAIVSDLKNNTSYGIDEVSHCIIKKIIGSVVHVLAFIFNDCLSKGVFPEKLKIGVIKPFFKKGSHLELNNYRPITLLSTFAKIFEKIIASRLIDFLDCDNFFS